MADLAFPLLNMLILGSFVVWGVVEYARLDR
jgi:hypothetical protein